MNRAMNFVISAIGLVVLSPVLAALALLIRINMGGPVMFSQIRSGKGGTPFFIHKFRTMRHLNGPNGQPLPDAERMTRLGSFLRRSSLDELPGLWNVVRGEMNLVGPRPLLHQYHDLYNADQFRRFEVRGGITGWAQVNGRNAVTWEEKFDLDIWYVDNRSLALDLRILAMTLKKVVAGSGVSQDGEATMEVFRGTPPNRA